MQVLAFVRRALPATPQRVLEVGCGRGELAAMLAAGGHEVTALDVDPEAVAAARAAGVPAIEGDFLDGRMGPHDAVLFTRSLHHVADLDRAAALAADACVPGGVVVLDEFARERADVATAAWFYEVRDLLVAAGALRAPEAPGEADPVERWEVEYGSRRAHRMHTGEAMVAALRAHFDVELVEYCPYLYRQLAQWLEPTLHRGRVIDRLLEVERDRLRRGELVALGMRAVARRRP
jgi:SAM-dependent methyltransferase